MQRQYLAGLETAVRMSLDLKARNMQVALLSADDLLIANYLSSKFMIGEPEDVRVALSHELEVGDERLSCAEGCEVAGGEV